jgi:hypothetical protein
VSASLRAGVSFSDVVDLVSVVVWPLVVLIAIAVAVSKPGQRLLRPVLRRLRKISGGGFAVELSPEAAAATKADVEGAIGAFATPLGDEFERLAYFEGVRDHLIRALDDIFKGVERPTGYRATVHVKDALYVDALYQLLDYWPMGGGSGRRYSIRFGLLGRSWRLGQTQYEKQVPVAARDLVTEWGMTREQAAQAGEGRRSFFCGTLFYDRLLVGAVYMDAKEAEAFPEDIVKRFDNSDNALLLARAVGCLREEIASRGPGIRLLQSD